MMLQNGRVFGDGEAKGDGDARGDGKGYGDGDATGQPFPEMPNCAHVAGQMSAMIDEGPKPCGGYHVVPCICAMLTSDCTVTTQPHVEPSASALQSRLGESWAWYRASNTQPVTSAQLWPGEGNGDGDALGVDITTLKVTTATTFTDTPKLSKTDCAAVVDLMREFR